MPMCRNRVISLRLAEQEYEFLKSRYASHGARNLSEFARDAMHRMLRDDPMNGAIIESRVQALDRKVAVLEGRISDLSRVVETEVAERKT
jgi:hypothetical protein